MGKHSEWAPSSAFSWLRCPSQIAFKRILLSSGKLLPDDLQEVPEYASEGTMLHEELEKTLKLELKDWLPPDEFDPELKDALDLVYKYLGGIISQLSDAGYTCTMWQLEERVSLNQTFPEVDMFGTADVLFVAENKSKKVAHVHLVDFKMGKGKFVEAWDNEQCQLYLMGFLETFGPEVETLSAQYEALEMYFHLVQPRMNNMKSYRISFAELDSFKRFVRSRLPLTNGLKHFRASKEICQFCSCKPHCEAHAEYVFEGEEMELMSAMGETDPAMTEERQVNLLRAKGKIEKFLKNLQSGFTDALKAGYVHPDMKLGRKMTRNAWKSDAFDKVLGLEGFDSIKFFTLKGRDECKKLGLPQEVIDDLSFKPTGDEVVKFLTVKEKAERDKAK